MIIAPRDAFRDLEDSIDIATTRLELRPLVETDVDDLWPVVSNPIVPQMMSWAAHKTREETDEWVLRQAEARARGTGLVWGIAKDGRVVGTIGLSGIAWHERALRVDRAELGYWIAPALWGQGYATEAARAVVAFGFDDLGLHKITTRCFAENAASRRVIEKCGFRFVGRLEEDVWRDGAWHAQLLYEIAITEWSDTTSTRPYFRPPRG